MNTNQSKHLIRLLRRFLFLGIFILAPQALGAIQTISLEDKKNYSINFPKSWKMKKDFFGVPFFLTPKKKSKQKASLTISLASNDFKPQKHNLNLMFDYYYENKRKWASKRNLKITKLIKQRTISRSKSSTSDWKEMIHSIGVEFEMGKKKIQEISYFYICDESVVLLKSMFETKDNLRKKEIDKMVRSFKCSG